jgi:hypothetical protein
MRGVHSPFLANAHVYETLVPPVERSEQIGIKRGGVNELDEPLDDLASTKFEREGLASIVA